MSQLHIAQNKIAVSIRIARTPVHMTLTRGRQGVLTSENSETMGAYYPWVEMFSEFISDFHGAKIQK